ncbi:expressed unknown protein [Seminavis robusta]|uniref:Uncharacterized protein n=1 Tax=Seminavis robusta TaxID=568900 RepID=A0A9N8E8V5_9STRA|nr:expressed unknown protein [Seminavis robusta]|eukprot:Sro800_g204340.1 n/a (329) ;mRNA; r:34258-35649
MKSAALATEISPPPASPLDVEEGMPIEEPQDEPATEISPHPAPPLDVEEGMPIEEHQDEPEEEEDTNGLTEEEQRERDEIIPYLLQHAYHLPTSICWSSASIKAANTCRKSGAFMTTLVVLVVMAITSFSVMLRASLESSNTVIEFDFSPLFNDTNGTNYTSAFLMTELDAFDSSNFTEAPIVMASDIPDILESHILVKEQLESLYKEQNFEDYLFVASYFVELIFTYIIYYPIFGTIMFSGVLSKCFSCYPSLLGGRPYEMQQLELAKQLKEEDMEKGEVEVEYNKTPDNSQDEDDDNSKDEDDNDNDMAAPEPKLELAKQVTDEDL